MIGLTTCQQAVCLTDQRIGGVCCDVLPTMRLNLVDEGIQLDSVTAAVRCGALRCRAAQRSAQCVGDPAVVDHHRPRVASGECGVMTT